MDTDRATGPDDRSDPGELISPQLFDRVAARAAAEHNMPPGLAEGALSQTLMMLHAIAAHPGTVIHPPRSIALVWRTLILHTADYTVLCQRLAGRYLHHTPADDAIDGGAAIQASARTLRDLGYEIDELWSILGATS